MTARPRWKAGVKRILFWFFYYSRLELLVARCINVDAAAVIMYHGVCNDSRLPPEVDFHLTPDAFERHMRMLKRRYPVISLRELLERLERGEPLQKAVVLTFDDGYRNNATVAHPILERHSLPYTIFLSTAYIGNDRWLPLNHLYAAWHFGRISDSRMRELRLEIRRQPASAASRLVEAAGVLQAGERELAESSFGMLSWDQVRHLAGQGVEFGSHTHTHCNMAAETSAQQLAELQAARDLIRAETGEDAATFAYPFGRSDNWNQETRASVIATGHRCAILAAGGLVKPHQDVFALPRVGYASKSSWDFACQLTLLFLRDYLKH
jgi:peptidoglycan/xylan/chitin deacetylase (PgdA/CDA1 family)